MSAAVRTVAGAVAGSVAAGAVAGSAAARSVAGSAAAGSVAGTAFAGDVAGTAAVVSAAVMLVTAAGTCRFGVDKCARPILEFPSAALYLILLYLFFRNL